MSNKKVNVADGQHTTKIRYYVILCCRSLAVILLFVAAYLNWHRNGKNVLESVASAGVIFLMGMIWLLESRDEEGKLVRSNILFGVIAATIAIIYALLIFFR